METIQNIVEYYDELYPVTESQKKFFNEIISAYSRPAKMMRIGCGTGVLENYFSQQGCDVTGLETFREYLDSAKRRRRVHLLSIRFFQMSTLEMRRFLCKGFYNVIFCLNDRIEFIYDRVLMRKFFFDSKELLSKGGTLVLHLLNYEKYDSKGTVELPVRRSIRAELLAHLQTDSDGKKYMQQELKTGTGKILPVLTDAALYPLKKEEIASFGHEAGFKDIAFYSNFESGIFTKESDYLVAVLR